MVKDAEGRQAITTRLGISSAYTIALQDLTQIQIAVDEAMHRDSGHDAHKGAYPSSSCMAWLERRPFQQDKLGPTLLLHT